ncbi:MAG: hypothetical protein FVQ82_14245 [Planctomycetes bacterium]|nr:hypothetical protein [Planctomycetota bacterium]
MPSNIFFDPVIPAGLIFGMAFVLAGLAVAGYMFFSSGIGRVRKTVLLTIRLVVLLLLVIILMRPMSMEKRTESAQKPVFAILADSSASMNTADVKGKKTRYQAMVSSLFGRNAGFVNKLRQNYDVRFYKFDSDIERTWGNQLSKEKTATGEDTHIAQSLMKAVSTDRKNKTRGMLVISDGRDNAPDSISSVTGAARYLRSMKIPVWTAAVGTSQMTKDVYVTARLSSSFIFVDQPASVHVSVSGSGYENWYAKVNLYREDEFVTTQQAHLRKGHASLIFPIHEEMTGSVRYRVEVEPLAGESDKHNNDRTIIARVIDEQTRVLVVEARPHWDSKFLLRCLRADKNIEVTSIFHINEKKSFAIVEKKAGDGTIDKTVTPGVRMPRTKGELYKYDCIFLGRDIDTVFSSDELRLLKDYLTDRGGSIVFFRGKAYTGRSSEIEAIEPINWAAEQAQDVRFELTTMGRSSPIFDYRPHAVSADVIIQQLPSMASVTRISGEKSLAVVLAKTSSGFGGEEVATVAYQRYGKGKVMSVGAMGLWQWSFLPAEMDQYDDIYQRFWGQMVRWLVTGSDFLPGQDISFLLDKNSYAPGEKVHLSVSTKLIDSDKYEPWIEITDPDGKEVMLVPRQQAADKDLYSTFFSPDVEGEYKAILHNNLGTPATEEMSFTVYQNALETRYVAADRELLEKLSSITGGEQMELDDLTDLPGKVAQFEQLSCEKTRAHDVWDRMGVFALLIGVMGAEWLVRRASGLV